jgi:hypothetical protein
MNNSDFKIVEGNLIIKAFWSETETVGIIQKTNDSNLANLGSCISLKLDEIDTILKNGSYLFEGERPAKFPNKKKITVVTKEDGNIEIKSEASWASDIITISKETLQKIYDTYKDNQETAK